MDRIEVNVVTGEVTVITLTEAEIAELQTRPRVVPVVSCSPWQFRKALNNLGLRSQIETYVQNAPQDVKDGYEFATEFTTHDDLMISVGAQLGKSQQEIVEFISYAQTL